MYDPLKKQTLIVRSGVEGHIGICARDEDKIRFFFIETVARRPAKQQHERGTKVKPVGFRNLYEQYAALSPLHHVIYTLIINITISRR